MPKSSKIKEHRTYSLSDKKRAIARMILFNNYETQHCVWSYGGRLTKNQMRNLMKRATLYTDLIKNHQKRRQNILKIRQKSLKTPHLGLKNLKKR